MVVSTQNMFQVTDCKKMFRAVKSMLHSSNGKIQQSFDPCRYVKLPSVLVRFRSETLGGKP
jgi:hypothetical protein